MLNTNLLFVVTLTTRHRSFGRKLIDAALILSHREILPTPAPHQAKAPRKISIDHAEANFCHLHFSVNGDVACNRHPDNVSKRKVLWKTLWCTWELLNCMFACHNADAT